MNLKHVMKRRTRKIRLFLLVSVCSLAYIGYVVVGDKENVDMSLLEENLHHSRKLLSNTSSSSSENSKLYPPDAFSSEQLKHGAVVLHVLGMIYMFIALAIVCDEFFVPTLGVITEKFQISEDVAGATFMAAGGSAPELFTSLIGIFFSKSNVGIGTIVGSAVFNILFVIGMCAVFSKDVLALTWWPLFRDVTFYSIDLILLICFFLDKFIDWHEALVLLLCYFAYVLFMKFNAQIENFVKSRIRKRSGTVSSSNQLMAQRPERAMSMPIIHSGGNRFRHGMLQLLIHSIDPLHADAKVHEKAMTLHAIATLKVVIGTTTPTQNERKDSISLTVDKDNNKVQTNGHITSQNGHTNKTDDDSMPEVIIQPSDDSENKPANQESSTVERGEQLLEEEEPLDLSWPSGWRKRITYVVIAPIIFPLWITLPDVRRPEKQRFFVVTFLGSILWIAGFSFLMVWWASTTGTTSGISEEVMGLTILAAGTSIPDLITSVIVAKKGFGDMAVSSSVGSNIFDITVGLPVPWILYAIIYNGESVNVDSNGLVCSICLLFCMLIAVIITIAASKWRMSKILGIVMLFLYVIFLVLSVILEVKIVSCPVEI